MRLLRFVLATALVAAAMAPSAQAAPPDSAATVDGSGAPDGAIPADSESAVDESTATRIATIYGHSVVVESLLAPASTVEALPDGHLRLTVSSAPVRVQRSGAWLPIDLTLVAQDGMLRPRVSPRAVAFSAGGSGPLATVDDGQGDTVEVSWPAGPLPAPYVAGSTALYSDVLPDVDLAVTATIAGLSHILVVKNASALSDPRLRAVTFALSSSSLTVSSDGSGGIVAANAAGHAVLATGSPLWWDSSNADSGVHGPGPSGEALPVSATYSGAAVSLDATAIADVPGLTFPVYVDPDLTTTTTGYTYVDSAYTNQNYWNGSGADDNYGHVGSISAGLSDDNKNHTTRTFWKMDISGAVGRTLLSASFNTTEVWAATCTKKEVQLWYTGTPSSSTTWNAQPTWKANLDQATVAYGRPECPQHTVGFDALAGVKQVLQNGQTILPLGLKATDESDYLSWKKFAGVATLVITYDLPPLAPTQPEIRPCPFLCVDTTVPALTNSTTPLLATTAKDPEGDNLTFTFEVWQGHSANPATRVRTGTVSGIASQAPARWTVSPALPAGEGDYEFRMRAKDVHGATGPWSIWRRFTLDTVPPAAPTLTASGPLSTDPDSFAGEVGKSLETVSITSAPSDNAWGYVYTVAPKGVAVSYPANAECGSTAGGYTVVCPGTVGASATETFTVPAAASTFTAWTFDAAGNAHSSGSHIDFYAQDSTLIEQGHLWSTAGGPRLSGGGLDTGACPQEDVPDLSTTAPQSLTVSGAGTCWEQLTGPVATGQRWALSLDGTGGGAVTSTGVADPSGAFTVASWLRPTAVGDAERTAISQNGTSFSIFRLGLSASGRWQFCVREHQASTPICAASLPATSGQWAYVAGVYNPQEHRALLYVSASGYLGGATTATTIADTLDWTSGKTVVGRAQSAGAEAQRWKGQVLHPVVMPGVASVRQLSEIGATFRSPADTALKDPDSGTDSYQNVDPQSYSSVPGTESGPLPPSDQDAVPDADAPRGQRPAAATAKIYFSTTRTPTGSDGIDTTTNPTVTEWEDVADSGIAVAGIPSQGETANAMSLDLGDYISVAVLNRADSLAAGTPGLVTTVTAVGQWNSVAVRIPDSDLLDTFGGDYAQRIHWVMFSQSAGIGAALEPTDVERVGDVTVLTVPASAGTMMLAAESGTQTGTGVGDYAASPLHPSAAWQVGAQTGSFTYSYPLAGPPVPAGPSPGLALSYDSGSVDGMTAATNNQGGPVGIGWSLAGGGFISRSYGACADDGHSGSGDQCWGADSDNAMISFAGHSGLLIHDTASGQWRLQHDDGTKIEHLTGATNGDNDGEYWRLTTTDGTKYYFGLNRLPGWDSGDTTTSSAWTVPVAGDDPGEPCYSAGSLDAACQQAWQWNLDYVVDTHGNSEAFYYQTEAGRYRLNGQTDVVYDRGGELVKVDYGMRAGTELSTKAPAEITFGLVDRCIAGRDCGLDSTSGLPTAPENWPDVPWDLACGSGTCYGHTSPSFFTTKMIGSVHAFALYGSTYEQIDTWTLSHKFPGSDDKKSPSLWLNQVQHTATPAGDEQRPPITLPPVVFGGAWMANRVAMDGDTNEYKRYRLSVINVETGGQIAVTYAGQSCTTTEMQHPESNTTLCFPQEWYSPAAQAVQTGNFHKYVVTSVVANPRVGGGDDDSTYYSYIGDPAWRYDDITPAVSADKRTWSVFAGYATVKVSHGDPDNAADRQTTVTTYMRGLDGTRADPAGNTRTVSVAASDGSTVPDSPAVAGQIREQQTFIGDSGSAGGQAIPGSSQLLTTTINTPWQSPAATADDGTHRAFLTGVSQTDTHALNADGSAQDTRLTTEFDIHGRPTSVNDLGDLATSSDDVCTSTSYADNDAANMLAFPARTTVVAAACTATPSLPADAISDTRTFYDGTGTVGAAPTVGDTTRTDIVDHYDGSTPAWRTTATVTYDALGRVTAVTDPRTSPARTTLTAYTPAGAGLLSKTVATSPLGWTTTTYTEPGRGSTTKVVDANNHTTTQVYDALGRLTEVWKPELTVGDANGASVTYTYHVSNTGMSWVSTRTRTGATWTMSYALYDGLARQRQTQSQAPNDAGDARVLTDNFYDHAGRVYQTNGTYFATGAPSGVLLLPTIAVPTYTRTEYDGAGRVTATVLYGDGAELYRTSYLYQGVNSVRTTPPAGGTRTAENTDARGRIITEALFHSTGAAGGPNDATHYTYDARGNMTSMVDAVGATWTWTYDSQGRVVAAHDPDSGTTTTTYDTAGRVATITDARGETVRYSYDLADRPTQLVDDDTGALISKWTYDTAGEGLPYSAISYDAGQPYTTTTSSYDPSNRPTQQSVTIPSAAGALAGTYTTNLSYWTGGLLKSQTLPHKAGLPAETLTFGYNQLGQPTGIGNADTTYLDGAEYTQYSQLAQTVRSPGSAYVVESYTHDQHTGRLTNDLAQRVTSSGAIIARHFLSWQDSGLLIGDVNNVPAVGVDKQCYNYDYAEQLTQAWTPPNTAACSNGPAAGLAGPAPYWQEFTYDAAGSRTSETLHAATSDDATLTDTYTYPAGGAARPHAVTTVTHASDDITTGHTDYIYNPAGGTTHRGGQTLSYDTAGRLADVTVAGGTEHRVYTTDGQLLYASGPGGTRLYLPGQAGTILAATVSGTISGQRTYSTGNIVAAQRTTTSTSASTVQVTIADPVNGTITATVGTDSAMTVNRYYTDPYGNLRGPKNTWPTRTGYLNAPVEPPTGLTRLGVRDYDPALGRFTTVDPILAPYVPQQNNGYTYAADNPILHQDPDGNCPFLMMDGEECGGALQRINEFDRTSKHNAAALAAATELSVPLSAGGYYFDMPESERIPYASKKNMNPDGTPKDPPVNLNFGIADLVSHPPSGMGFSQVWEVKSYSQKKKAKPEAAWYAYMINQNQPGRQAQVGSDYHIFARVPGYDDTWVWSDGEGAIIYGSWEEFKEDTHWSEAKLRAGQQSPPATSTAPNSPPAPTRPDIPGVGSLEDNLGLGAMAGIIIGLGLLVAVG